MNIFARFFRMLFKKNLKTTDFMYDECNHIYDRSWAQPGIVPCWNNVHGYLLPDNEAWFACVDMRVCGIRVQNIIVETKVEDHYNYWLNLMKDSNKIIDTIKTKPNVKRGNEYDTKYIFRTTDGDRKDYNITDSGDFYLED